jgi:hypothetical protein
MLTVGCAGGWVSTCSVVVTGGLSASASEFPLQPLAAIAMALRPATTMAFRDTRRTTSARASFRAAAAFSSPTVPKARTHARAVARVHG